MKKDRERDEEFSTEEAARWSRNLAALEVLMEAGPAPARGGEGKRSSTGPCNPPAVVAEKGLAHGDVWQYFPHMSPTGNANSGEIQTVPEGAPGEEMFPVGNQRRVTC